MHYLGMVFGDISYIRYYDENSPSPRFDYYNYVREEEAFPLKVNEHPSKETIVDLLIRDCESLPGEVTKTIAAQFDAIDWNQMNLIHDLTFPDEKGSEILRKAGFRRYVTDFISKSGDWIKPTYDNRPSLSEAGAFDKDLLNCYDIQLLRALEEASADDVICMLDFHY